MEPVPLVPEGFFDDKKQEAKILAQSIQTQSLAQAGKYRTEQEKMEEFEALKVSNHFFSYFVYFFFFSFSISFLIFLSYFFSFLFLFISNQKLNSFLGTDGRSNKENTRRPTRR